MATTAEKITLNNVNEGQWIESESYSFRIVDNVIQARNSKGRILKTVPAKAKQAPEFKKLDALRSYLHQHEISCADTVRSWFLKGLPAPSTVIAAVWADPAWQRYLKDLVIRTADGATGLLRAAVPDKGLSIVDLDGETLTIPAQSDISVTIPHPAVLDDIEQWREFAVELDIHQGTDQLFRDLYPRPTGEDKLVEATRKYEGATYDKASHFIGRSRGGGFTATMNSIALTVVENGAETTAVLAVDAWDPFEEAQLYRLSFHRENKEIPPAEVGPISWSEAIRMCEFVYAGCTDKPTTI